MLIVKLGYNYLYSEIALKYYFTFNRCMNGFFKASLLNEKTLIEEFEIFAVEKDLQSGFV